jgi:toxin ParE1/3/4
MEGNHTPGKTLIVGPTSRRDLLQIWNYIADDNADAADRMIERIEEAFEQLRDYPESGRVRPDLAGDREARFWHVGDYQIIYRVTELAVEIVSVLHGSRDIPAVLREREPEE